MLARAQRRPGAVLATAAIFLIVLLGIVALVIDGGMLFEEKRHGQAAADAAALAAATDLYKNWNSNTAGADPQGTARASALSYASANGYSNDGSSSTVTVRLYPDNYLGGPKAGTPLPKGYAEVTITSNRQRYFSNIFGTGDIPVSARAVARGRWTIPKWGVLLLDPSADRALNMSGQGNINVETGIVMVNSSSNTAVYQTNNGYLEANELNINGGATLNGTVVTDPPDNINYTVPPVADPLASLPAPSMPSNATSPIKQSPSAGAVKPLITTLTSQGILNATIMKGIKNAYVLEPGRYTASGPNKMPSFQSSDLVIMKQALNSNGSSNNGGIYYLEGGFSSQGASLVMHPTTSGGLMFYNAGAGNNDKINMTGNQAGVVNLTGLQQGPYEGFILFQARASTQQIQITGNGAFNVFGSIYAPNAELNLTGNGASQTIGSQLIAKSLSLSGNGTINVTMSSGSIAPIRQLELVE